MKKLIVIVGILMGIVMVSLIAGGGAPALAAPKIIWNESTMKVMYTAPWTEFYLNKMTENSGGEITWDIYWGESLGHKASTFLRVSRDGLAPFSDAMSGFIAGDLPELMIAELPMLTTSWQDFEKARPKLEPLLSDVLDKKWNSVLLSTWPMPPRVIWSTKPVKSWRDLKGMKIRCLSAPETEFLKGIGATAVVIPWPEVFTSLQRGVVDGVITADAAFADVKLYEVAKYRIVQTGATFWMNFANKDYYNSLPPKFKKAIEEAKQPGLDFVLKDIPELDKKTRANVEKQGCTWGDLPDSEKAELTEIGKPIWEKWANINGPVAQEALKRVREVMGK